MEKQRSWRKEKQEGKDEKQLAIFKSDQSKPP